GSSPIHIYRMRRTLQCRACSIPQDMSKPTGVESVRDWQFAVRIALVGLGSGVALWLLTTVLSRSTISGNGWSLSGNGALIVPFGLGPAVVAAGWTAIILRMRGHPRWLQLGLASGLVGVGLVAGSILSLVAFGPRHRDAGA